MVDTFQIKPAPLLLPFVHCYSLRTFDAECGLLKPQHAQNEYYLCLFLKKDGICELSDNAGKSQRQLSDCLCTLYSEPNGSIFFKGSFSFFSVQFKANGVSAILGIPQRILINSILAAEDILGNDLHLLTEKLALSGDINTMRMHMDAYLLGKLLSRKHKTYTNAIAFVAQEILKNKGLVSIDALAYEANMSLRNFERRFIDEVGVSPKLYMRVTRFYGAIENKMLYPQKNWTAICYESGYFDQAHFIKECREFSLRSPEELFTYTPPPTENYTGKVEI